MTPATRPPPDFYRIAMGKGMRRCPMSRLLHLTFTKKRRGRDALLLR